jgi:hypothetical protein
MKTSVVLLALRLLVKLIPGDVDDRLLEYVETLLAR